MKKNTLATVIAVLAILGASLVANAAPRNKRSKITFSHSVRVPGATLAAGSTYIFKLVDTHGNRRVVRITNEAEDQVLATILAIPDYRHQPTSHTVVEFGEPSAGSPTPIKAWFYPGDSHGFRFVYPKQEAEEIASTFKQPVPEEPESVPVAPTIVFLRAVPFQLVFPDKKVMEYAPAELAKADVSDKAGVDGTTVETAEALPKTASYLPLLALLGMLLLAGSGLAWIGWKKFPATGGTANS
jgi:hypothetical protein